ncbi:MAG: ATP-binding cassette domain-containing protein [Pseudomonadota bacterium]
MMATPPRAAEDPPRCPLFASFDYDALLEALVAGRMTGQPMDPRTGATLLLLLEKAGWKTHLRRLSGALPHFATTLNPTEIRATMSDLGFTSRIMPLRGHALVGAPNATLVVDGRGGFWLHAQDKKGRWQLFQPAVGPLPGKSQRIERQRTYTAILFEPRNVEGLGPDASQKAASWFGQILRRFQPELRFALALTLLSGGVTLVVAFAIMMIFNVVVTSRNTDTIWAIFWGILLIFAADLSLRAIKAQLFGRIAGRMEYILGSSLFSKLLTLPSAMVTGAPISEQMARMRQFETVRDIFSGPPALIVLELPIALMLLVVITVLAWPLGLALIGLIAVILLIAGLFVGPIQRRTRSLSAAQSHLTRLMLEILACRQQIGRDGLAWVYFNRFDLATRELARRRRRLSWSTSLLEALAHASLPLAATTVIFLGTTLVLAGALSGGQLVAATILTWRVVAPVQQIAQLMSKIPDLRALVRQIDALMRIDEEDARLEEPGLDRIEGPLALRSVAVRHPKSVMPVFAGATLALPYGVLVAVTGPSGSGKSTLLKIMAGQMAPQSGFVQLGPANLHQMSLANRARNIALVGARPLFFYGSVAQNLRLIDPAAPNETLTELLVSLGLGPWLDKLPNGIDTRLDPSLDSRLFANGVASSIAVAQALLSDPAVLLLDEPASGYDQDLEDRLHAVLEARRRQMTSVIVSQRPSVLRTMDAVITVAEGGVKLQRVDRQSTERAAG